MTNSIKPYTSKQAANTLGISMTKFYKLVKENLIKPIPGVNRFARAEIERFARGEK